MGKRSREKKERGLMGEIEPKKERMEIGIEVILKKIILVGTSLILFTPLILSGRFFFPFVGPKSLYFIGISEIIFFAWLFLVIIEPKFRPRFNKILGSLILFLIILIISAAFGVDPSYSFWSKFERITGILMMLHLFAFFLVISSTFREKDWRIIFAISILVGVIIGIIASTSENPAMRQGGTLGNDSFLGTYLLFNLFFALYLIFKNEFRIYSSIGFLIILTSLFLSGARAAKLSFLGGLVLLFFLWLIFCQKGRLKWVGVSLLSLSIVLALSFIFFAFQPESFVRKGIIEKEVGETFGGRFVVWQKAWESFLEKPILGWGPENFEFAFTKNYHPCMGTFRCGADIWYDRAHNIIFDTLVTSGILGMLAYLGIFISAFYVLWKNYPAPWAISTSDISEESKRAVLEGNKQKTKSSGGGVNFWLSGTFTALLISYSIQNLTVFDMVSSYMTFFLVLGFIGSINQETIPSQNYATRPRSKIGSLVKKLISVIILIFFCFSFSKFVIKPLQTDSYVIETLQTQDFQKRLSLSKKTLETSPVGRYQIRDFFSEQLINLYESETGKTIPSELLRAEFDFTSQELEKSIKESPLNFRAYLQLGKTYIVFARFDVTKLSRAEEVLKRAIELSPTNQQAYWALAQIRVYQGDFNEALSLAEKTVELEPKLIQPHLIVIQIAKFMGNEALAKEKAERAIKIDPSWESRIKEILGG